MLHVSSHRWLAILSRDGVRKVMNDLRQNSTRKKKKNEDSVVLGKRNGLASSAVAQVNPV